MTTLSYKGFPERVDVSGTKGSGMLVGDHLAHFTTLEPYEDGAVEGTGGDDATDKANDPAALGHEGHLSNVRDFVLAVREGREPLVSATEARRAVNLLNMIYKAAKVGPYA
jgi:predicted dehydrogenase